MTPDRVAEARDTIAAAAAACQLASQATEAIEDPDVAFRIATELTRALRAATDEHGATRQRIAARLYDARELTLEALAGEHGLSKAQMGALVKAGRQAGTAEPAVETA